MRDQEQREVDPIAHFLGKLIALAGLLAIFLLILSLIVFCLRYLGFA